MPGSVLDVARVHRQVRLELGAAIRKASGVVERNTALPELRSEGGDERGQIVELLDGFGDAAVLEIGNRTIENRLWRLRKDGNSEDQREELARQDRASFSDEGRGRPACRRSLRKGTHPKARGKPGSSAEGSAPTRSV